MPRYFFDVSDRGYFRDEEGSECVDEDAARDLAMRSLPEMVRFTVPNDGDKQAYTMIVRDEAGTPIYTATLTFTGLRLNAAD